MKRFSLFLLFFMFSCSVFDKNKERKKNINAINIPRKLGLSDKARQRLSEYFTFGTGPISYESFIKKHDIDITYDKLSPLIYGNKDAKHLLVAFVDIACIHSKKAFFTIKKLVDINPRELSVAFVLFPMDPKCNYRLSSKMKGNSISCRASKLVMCAKQNNEYIDILSEVFSGTSLDSLEKKYKSCINTKVPEQELREMVSITKEIKFRGVPFVILDKKPIGRLFKSEKNFFMLLNYIDNVKGK